VAHILDPHDDHGARLRLAGRQQPSAISTPPWAASLDATVRVPAGGAERHSNA